MRPEDICLMMLERMRMIDVAHSWSESTLKQYSSKIRLCLKFEQQFGINPLTTEQLEVPPTPPSLALQWIQTQYQLYPSDWHRNKKKTDVSNERVTFATVRGIRSDSAQYHAYDLAKRGGVIQDEAGRPVPWLGCSPTDDMSYTQFSSGLARRLGDESCFSIALQHRHIQNLDEQLRAQYNSTTDSMLRADLAKAALVNLFSWTGWLRSSEVFGLRFCDVMCVEPENGPSLELPLGFGAISLRLLEQTKSNQTQQADVWIAYTTNSGLSAGQWWNDLLQNLPLNTPRDSLIFRHGTSSVAWDSRFFRTKYLIPSLALQRAAGDKALLPFDDTPGNTLLEKFWSMHSYRRGGRTRVSKKDESTIRRKATPEEVNEHGRWRRSRRTMDMPTLYLEWTVPQRLAITQFCM
jgi:hypothetical protein